MAGHKQNGAAAREPRDAGDYYEMQGEFFTWYVSVETAARIGRQLDRRRRRRPRWIKFVDVHGARAWVRSDSIFHLTESNARQRLRERDLDHMLFLERQADERRRYSDCDEE
jgi:hypothetical protein